MLDTDPTHHAGGVPREKVRPPTRSGIERPRLTARLLDQPPGLRLVVGPAGSGKTTALAHAAQAFDGRRIWLSLDGTDRQPSAFARSLAAATSLGVTTDVLQVVAALDDGAPALLVIDDVHQVAGSPGGEAIDLLCRYRPPQLSLAFGARDLRDLHQWRWRSDATARMLDLDQLRFRLWEVDELFRHLDLPLAPPDLHVLTQRTDGWAVALRLFHVALRDSGDDAAALLARSPRFTHRSIRGYLREEVLARVTAEERLFLRCTAVLDRLRPSSCDELLDRSASAAQLEDLAASGLVVPQHDGSSFRLHELLRDHLLAELAVEVGDEAVADLHRKAALILEREGAIPDAIRAASRGGDWEMLRRLLRRESGEVTTSLHAVADIPGAVRDRDPWILRAVAIRQLGEADLTNARTTLRLAVERFSESGGDAGTEALLRSVDAWLRPVPGPPRSWVSALRSALGGAEVTAWPMDQGGRFARGVTELARGRVADARSSLAVAATGPQPTISAMAAIALSAAVRLSGAAADAYSERAMALARAAGAPAAVVAAEIVASGIALADQGDGEADHVGMAFQAFWLALANLAEDRSDADDTSDAETVLAAQSLVLPSTVARAAGLLAGVARGRSLDRRAARDPSLRAAGPLAQALVSLAVAVAHDDPAARSTARRLAGTNGFGPWLQQIEDRLGRQPCGPEAATAHGVGVGVGVPTVAGGTHPGLRIHVFGGFAVARPDGALDIEDLRPRHLELLQVLAVNANRWMHRESLWELLWPDRPREAAAHNLHVAVSAVRRLLEPEASRGQSSVLPRSGDRYRLEVDVEGCDVCRFEQHLHRAGVARRRGDNDDAAEEIRQALGEWRGDLVPGAGPVEWAVSRREELRRRLSETAAGVLADLEPTMESSALAANVLAIDPFDDLLWRHAIRHAHSGGAAARLQELRATYAARFADDIPHPAMDGRGELSFLGVDGRR